MTRTRAMNVHGIPNLRVLNGEPFDPNKSTKPLTSWRLTGGSTRAIAEDTSLENGELLSKRMTRCDEARYVHGQETATRGITRSLYWEPLQINLKYQPPSPQNPRRFWKSCTSERLSIQFAGSVRVGRFAGRCALSLAAPAHSSVNRRLFQQQIPLTSTFRGGARVKDRTATV